MLHVVAVNWRNYQGCGVDYVNRLFAMVARNLDVGTEGKFTVFTDNLDDGYHPSVHVEPLPLGLEGWYNKLFLFSPGLFKSTDRVLYFDLDTVIVGDLDEIARYNGEFAILRDFYRPNGLQSSAMAWRGGFGAEIWQKWNSLGRPEMSAGDQEWIENNVSKPDLLQDLYPGKFVSYKAHCQPFPPEGSSVVVFHGEPRPHNCGRPWVESMWTESDTGHFQIGMVANVPLDQIRKQIKHSATLDLPRLTSKPPHDTPVAIVGGGPSLSDPITLAQLNRDFSAGCKIWALNATYDWLLEHGLVADAHVILDARVDNAGFLHNSHKETTYYISSQCNWAVFDKLARARSRPKVIRMDLDTMGDCGTTVGTHAILASFVEGFRDIHLYGFDSSYREDAGHAYRQGMNDSERVVEAHIGDRVFKAAPWMVRQAQDFEGIARDIVAAGGRIIVHGDGLLPYWAKLLAEAPRRAALVRAEEILKRLPEGPVLGAEIGVFCGEMSAVLLQRNDLSLMMVDSWEGDGAAYAAHSGDWHARLHADKQEAYYQHAKAAAYFARDRSTIYRLRSTVAAALFEDDFFDFVFIDADHSYVGCKADIDAWAPKLKPGGLLSGHDYDHPDFPEFGVKRAVDDFAAHRGLSVELGDNLTWFIRL